MLDAVISDANALAREFWLRSFKTKEGTIRDSVPWKEFVKVLPLEGQRSADRCVSLTKPCFVSHSHLDPHQILQHSAPQEDHMEGRTRNQGAPSRFGYCQATSA
jgi:hypothetical protein